MSYVIEPIDVIGSGKMKEERVIDPRHKKTGERPSRFQWWLAQGDKDLASEFMSTAQYLKRQQEVQERKASIYSRLFCGKPLYSFLASTSTLDTSDQLPMGRPTANVVYSNIDTLTSRITIDKPQPTFLTDAGNYKERKLSKQANQFVQGEFHRLAMYDLVPLQFRDSCVLDGGFVKFFAKDDKVATQRVMSPELLVDYNDSYYGNPRELIHYRLIDRGVAMSMFPKRMEMIANAQKGTVDTSSNSNQTIADQIIIAEGWHLRSGKNFTDGRHVMVCSSGVILDEDYQKDTFPFTRMLYNPNLVGWKGQGLGEILMPIQMELYRSLIVASQSLELMGVPRVLIDEMSKILETSFNNRIGSIIKFRGNPPIFSNAQANNPEMYQWISFLINLSYQISGNSMLSAGGVHPPGIDSGEALRKFEQIQDARFSALQKRYQSVFTDSAYLIIETAKDIAESTGKPYVTTYPDKDGTRQIDFRSIGMLKDTYVIQCYEQSSLPKDPAGRQQKLSEMLATGEISHQEFRRLSNFPDLQQSDQLAAALEERILQNLDAIVEDGKKGYREPDPFILDPTDLATRLSVNYINKYSVTNLEEEKMQLLRDYFQSVQDLKMQAMPPQPQPGAQQPESQLSVQPPQPQIAPTSGIQV